MRAAAAFATGLVLAFPVWAGDRVQAELDGWRAEHGFPGATVAWIGAVGAVQTRTTGWSDPDARAPMTPDTRMLAASIGKSFVAAAVLALDADAALDLRSAVGWLGDRPWFGRLPNHEALTLRHLLTHSGGLPDHVNLPAFRAHLASLGLDDPAPEPERLIALVLDGAPLFPAGEGWSYSDTGYLLVGLVIEAASGRPWTEVVRTRFLDPLALADTEPSDRRDLARLAVGFSAMGDAGRSPVRTLDADGRMVWHPGIEGAGGGFITSAADLARWGWHLWSGRAMAAAYLNEMLAAVPIAPEAPNRSYGLAVSIDHAGAFGEVRGHGGWIPSYVSSVRYYPAHNLAIAIQINTDAAMLGPEGAFDRIERAVTTAILEQPE